MRKVSPLCPYRTIGRVQIVDLIPRLTGGEGRAWLEVMERHFFQGLQRAVVANISNLIDMDDACLRKLMLYLERPLKVAIYTNDIDRARKLMPDYIDQHLPLFSEEEELVKHFGLDFIERGQDVVSKAERRRYERFKAVMPAEIITKDKKQIVTKAIVSNISEGGTFLQYLNIEGSMKMAGLRRNPRVPVEIILKHPGMGSQCELIKGYIVRVVMAGSQRGIAVRFVPSLTKESLLVKRFKGEAIENSGDIVSAQK